MRQIPQNGGVLTFSNEEEFKKQTLKPRGEIIEGTSGEREESQMGGSLEKLWYG